MDSVRSKWAWGEFIIGIKTGNPLAISLLDRTTSSNGSHNDVALIAYYALHEKFKFANRKWYVYNLEKETWERDATGKQIYFSLGAEVSPLFSARAIQLSFMAAKDEGNCYIFEERSKKLTRIARNLKQTSYRTALLADLKALFHDPTFSETKK